MYVCTGPPFLRYPQCHLYMHRYKHKHAPSRDTHSWRTLPLTVGHRPPWRYCSAHRGHCPRPPVLLPLSTLHLYLRSKMSSSEPEFLLSCEPSAAKCLPLEPVPTLLLMSKCELPNTGHSAVPESEPPGGIMPTVESGGEKPAKGRPFLGLVVRPGPFSLSLSSSPFHVKFLPSKLSAHMLCSQLWRVKSPYERARWAWSPPPCPLPDCGSQRSWARPQL